MYREIIARSSDPKATRKMDSPFNKVWAQKIRPKLTTKQKISGEEWWEAYEAADIPRDDEIWTWYRDPLVG